MNKQKIKENKEDWLETWEMYKAIVLTESEDERKEREELEKLEKESEGEAPGFDGVTISEFDLDPMVGEIRLLSHNITGETMFPVYMLVIHHVDGEYMITPFGFLTIPATPGELGEIEDFEDDDRLQVLCTWNTRIVPKEILEQSWLISNGFLEISRKVHGHFRSLIRGLPFDHEISDQIGPPVEGKNDPTLEYQEFWKQQLSKLDDVCLNFPRNE
jgi:hypothetical protein